MGSMLFKIILIVIGLAFAFFGLPIYKGTIKLVGFLVGAAYAIYLFSIFASQLVWDELFIYLAGVILVLILGLAGIVIARFANAVMFFLAGGMVGVFLGKFIMGIGPGVAVGQGFLELIKPTGTDLIWFLGGGFIFLIAIDALLIILLSAFGAGIIWFVISPMGIMKPDWVIPLIVGILGLMTQAAARKRAKGERVSYYKPPARLPPKN